MKRREFEQTVRALSRLRPFKPFVIEVSDGTRITVMRPDRLAFNGGTLGGFDRRGGFFFYAEKDVVRITNGCRAPSRSGNGRPT